MKRCRCCRQTWPLECFYLRNRTRDGFADRHARCAACWKNCGIHRKRRAVATTKAWKAQLRADVMAVRAARAA